jgi:ATP-dependent Lhr-like helicase
MINSVFSKLNPKIQELLISNEIYMPTKPQTKAIPHILNGENILLIAPTGLGKTESAILPIFNNFLKLEKNKENSNKNGISILYITPLRALNRDMLRRTIEWGRILGIKIAVRHGDTTKSERAYQSKNPPDMLITTPETFQIMFIGKRLREHLKKIRWVIIDEIHELAHDERGAQLSVGLERLFELIKLENHDFQRIGLSATVGAKQEVSKFLAGFKDNNFRDVRVLEVDVSKKYEIDVVFPDIDINDNIDANSLSLEPYQFASLKKSSDFIDNHKSTLLFVNTRDGAEVLASRFSIWRDDLPIGVHHGSLSKNARIESEEAYKKGEIKALICTSSLELGIDVGNTDFVIQYNSPREVTRIVQRIGRSGHKIGQTSKGVIISSNSEDLAESLVISRRALVGDLELFKVRQNPLSVLSNQIISIALEYGKISSNKIFKIIKRAYPFHRLKFDFFNKIILQLKNQRSIWIEDENIIVKRRNSRTYFLDNISMIPDEKTFMAVDISSRRKIGKLDESFVINYGFEGAKFILHGRPWIIIKRDEEEILVSQTKELGNVPSWVGEDIPIPFEVAKEVGELRRLLDKNENITNYPCKSTSFDKIIHQIKLQKSKGFVVPNDKTITIEIDEKTIIINLCFGTKVNETLGRIISAIIGQSIGESVGISNDAYRINLELPQSISPNRIKEILMNIKPESLWYLINTILKNSNYIRWHLIHTARKFGSLRKDFDYRKIGSRKLLNIFDNTLIFDEAIDKIIWEKMDIQNTQKILSDIQNGDIEIVIQKISPIALTGLEGIKGLMVPHYADRSILMALKRRLENSDILLVCTNCYKSWNTNVKRAESQPKCSNCGAIKISVLPKYNMKNAKILNKKNRNKDEEKEFRRLHKNASIILNYGKLGLYALVGRGIGPETASRILRKYNKNEVFSSEENELKFLRDMIKAELNYARTRGFWDK